jgi:hypothetical protein
MFESFGGGEGLEKRKGRRDAGFERSKDQTDWPMLSGR